ncbi:SigE family RNA polymerase sigma factor [Dactylosporangium sp. NPDC000244]|uniref:SigE family RNA polymerase sigma factor n=1 Tax=Dactylosporangium sp. NPDC000244 TaxID=3154365 RepID=UPI0033166845
MTFDEFVHARLPALLRFAAVLAGDRELAQDVVQDALVIAHGRWSRIDGMARPELYVKKIVTSQYLSWRRRVVRRAELWQRRGPDVLTVPDHAEHAATRAAVLARLAALPHRQRAVLVLRYYEGLGETETAEVLGCAPGTVRSAHARALAALRLDTADLEAMR